MRGPLRLVSTAAFLLIFAVLLFPALELTGLQPRTGLHLRQLSHWSYDKGLPLLATIVICYALMRITGLLVTRFEHELNRGTSLDALERAKRARTLGSVINKVVTVALSAVALLMVLTAFGLNIAPVLTGAGILGLAVGFGAQTLVRDVISGFFLILEDQVRVGDVAAINGVAGTVEALNLRTIVLRDGEGTVHVFPNGAIQTLANRSKDFSYYVIDLGISYRDDPDRVAAILAEIGAEMQADPAYAPWILEPVEILGVDAFARLVGGAEAADQDGPAQAVGRRTRVQEAAAATVRTRQGSRCRSPSFATSRRHRQTRRPGPTVSSRTEALLAGFCPFDS